EKIVPGRNYEFTERFHASMRTHISGNVLTQATAFEATLDEEFRKPLANSDGDVAMRSDGGGSSEAAAAAKALGGSIFNDPVDALVPQVVLSPLLNDGSVM